MTSSTSFLGTPHRLNVEGGQDCEEGVLVDTDLTWAVI